jgi:hypothetical protein
MTRFPLFTWIGNAAAAVLGRHGSVTQQAQQTACSRQTVYDHAAKVCHAVQAAHAPGPSRADLLRDRELLRAENQQLWAWLAEVLETPLPQQQQFAASGSAMGLSLQQIVTLLAIVLPAAQQPSRATVGRWVKAAAVRASGVLAVLDRACQRLVHGLCLDEIFCHRQPVLMGVEPYSLAWVLGQRSADRSAATWQQALAAWPQVEDVAADGGSGLQSALAQIATQRASAAAAPAALPAPPLPPATVAAGLVPAASAAGTLHVQLDLFHTSREGARALRHEWQHAETVWQRAEAVEHARARLDRRGQDRRGCNRRRACAWRRASAALDKAAHHEQAWQRARRALAIFRPDGQLNEASTAAAELTAAAACLPGPRWAKTRRQLEDPRSRTFLARLHEKLAVAEGRPEVRAALVACWRQQHQRPAGTLAPAVRRVVQAAVRGSIRRQWGAEGEQAYERVAAILGRVVRASSVVECLNSVVRMHQARHRTLTQGLLDLKRLYWNGGRFVGGRRRKRCPYQLLGLGLPSYDPWVLLQMDPKVLEQQLSTPKLTE